MAQANSGRFVRYDLMTTDPDAARAFYSALFGWTAAAHEPMPGFKATQFMAGDAVIGGVVPFEAQPQLGSHWICYVAVDDIEAVCAAAEGAGGKVCVPPFALPGLGTFAVLEDPHRAFISPIQLEQGDTPRPEPGVGRVCWHQLIATDPTAVVEFYRATFGWSLEPDESWPDTRVVKLDGVPIAAVKRNPAGPDDAPDPWLPYIAVESCVAAEARAIELGGEALAPTTTVPGACAVAVMVDPTGAQFALWQDLSAG